MLNLTPFVVVCVATTALTIALALYRKFISAGESDIVYLGPGEEGRIPQQQFLATRLAVIDKWGKMLTVAAVVSGVALAVVFLYNVWIDTGLSPLR